MKVVLAAVFCLLASALWAAPPTDLRTDSICRDRFTARWTNAAGVVSNALEVVTVFPDSFEADYATNYTFSAFTNMNSTAVINVTNRLAVCEPGFSGMMVYAAANSVGVLQIGSTEKKGWLEFEGLDSYTGLTLVIRAQTLGRVLPVEMPIEWSLDKQSQTIGMTTILVASSMDYYEVALTNVANGARLVFRSIQKGDPRVLVDSISFVHTYTLPYSQTNAVHAAVFPARDSYRVRGLEPLTRYLWRVRGDAANDWSKYVTCETTDVAPPPLTVRVR